MLNERISLSIPNTQKIDIIGKVLLHSEQLYGLADFSSCLSSARQMIFQPVLQAITNTLMDAMSLCNTCTFLQKSQCQFSRLIHLTCTFQVLFLSFSLCLMVCFGQVWNSSTLALPSRLQEKHVDCGALGGEETTKEEFQS